VIDRGLRSRLRHKCALVFAWDKHDVHMVREVLPLVLDSLDAAEARIAALESQLAIQRVVSLGDGTFVRLGRGDKERD
jgi:hypothetical protein